eukprot:UC1_evm2s1939
MAAAAEEAQRESSQLLLQSQAILSMRIVSADHYMAQKPLKGLDEVYSTFLNRGVDRAPILRLFGVLASGQKCCAHIHGVRPYILVPSPWERPTQAQLRQLAQAVNVAVHESLDKEPGRDVRDQVAHIEECHLTPFYGYHAAPLLFLRIRLFNPRMLTRVANLLADGRVLGQVLQPHESHINYTMQFLIDYNLHGMDFLHTRAVQQRLAPGEVLRADAFTAAPAIAGRHSTCELEIDVLASDILNPHEPQDGEFSNPGLVKLWAQERAQRARAGATHITPTPPVEPERGPRGTPTTNEARVREDLRCAVAADRAGVAPVAQSSSSYAATNSTISPRHDRRMSILLSQPSQASQSQSQWTQGSLDVLDMLVQEYESDASDAAAAAAEDEVEADEGEEGGMEDLSQRFCPSGPAWLSDVIGSREGKDDGAATCIEEEIREEGETAAAEIVEDDVHLESEPSFFATAMDIGYESPTFNDEVEPDNMLPPAAIDQAHPIIFRHRCH